MPVSNGECILWPIYTQNSLPLQMTSAFCKNFWKFCKLEASYMCVVTIPMYVKTYLVLIKIKT